MSAPPTSLRRALDKRGYAIDAPLASHSLARTFRGRAVDDDQPLVIKALDIKHLGSWKTLELFERQWKTLAALDHPALPTARDSFWLDDEETTLAVLLFDYIPGTPLDALDHGAEHWSEHELLGFLKEVLAILAYLHVFSPPVVHRDIKPANLIRRPDGSYALIDFGAVQALQPHDLGDRTFVGTHGFMPPEQALGQARPASDIYALGATAIALATGKSPLELRRQNLHIEVRDELALSASTESILQWMVQPDIDRRAGDANALLRAIEAGLIVDPDRDSSLPDDAAITVRRRPGSDSTTEFITSHHTIPQRYLDLGITGLVVLGYSAWFSLNLVYDYPPNTMDFVAILGAIAVVHIFAILLAFLAIISHLKEGHDWDDILQRLRFYHRGFTRPTNFLLALLFIPYFIASTVIVAFLLKSNDRVLQEERLRITDDHIHWERLEGPDERRTRQTTSLRRDNLQDIRLDQQKIILNDADQRVVFDLRRSSDEEHQWLLNELKTELNFSADRGDA